MGVVAEAVPHAQAAPYVDKWETWAYMQLEQVWLHRIYLELRYLHEHIVERKTARRRAALVTR